MGNAVWNGKAYTAYYRVASDHSGIVPPAGGSVISTPAISDAALILSDSGDELVMQTEWAADAAGIYTNTIKTSVLAVRPFLDVACPAKKGAASGIVKKEYISETGNKAGGAGASSGVNYLVINANAYNDTIVVTNMAIVTVSRESDKTTAVAGDMKVWDVKNTSVAAKQDLVIPNALFPATIYDIDPAIGAGDRTIEEDAYILTANLPIAA